MRDDQQRALSSYIAEKRSDWVRRAAGNLWDARQLANDLGTDARFAALDLCGFWNGPTTSDVREILLPMASLYGWGPPIEVIADAVTMACDRCRSNRQATAALIGMGAAAVGAILIGIGRRSG
ncbi:MAG: hypothetical protein ACYDEA_03030 [Candidatus Dormibacteria bacterium]